MCYIIVPEEIKKKERIVKPYKIGAGKFKEDTPDYILKLHEEIMQFYSEETDGMQ